MFTPAQKSLNNEVSVNVSGKDTSTDNVQEDFGYPDQDSLVPDSLMIDAGDLPDGDELTLQDEGEPPELSSDGDTGALAEDIPPGCGDNIKNGSEACDGTRQRYTPIYHSGILRLVQGLVTGVVGNFLHVYTDLHEYRVLIPVDSPCYGYTGPIFTKIGVVLYGRPPRPLINPPILLIHAADLYILLKGDGGLAHRALIDEPVAIVIKAIALLQLDLWLAPTPGTT